MCLTRGYTNLRSYGTLIRRNRAIYEAINRYQKQQYPLVIWHEGNISPDHERHILSRERNSDVRFVDISRSFRLPDGVSEAEFLEHWPTGYRLMCRFQSYHIWQYSREFRYLMRLDEDCIIQTGSIDPIDWLSRARADFATVVYAPETHELTNRTLRAFVRRFEREVFPGRRTRAYDQFFPYTNFYVTRTTFWRRRPVQRFLSAVIRDPDFLRCRWGDIPVLGVALNLFAEKGRMALLPNFAYEHGSHGLTLVGSDEAARW